MSNAWRNEQFWVSGFNYLPEVRRQLNLPQRVYFHDVTLRDGEQSPGVVFRPDEKVQVARMLDQAGVDRIEVALPAVSAADVQAVKSVVAMRPRAKVFVLSRASQSDVDLALECGVDGIILEGPVGTPRLQYQFKDWTENDVLERFDRWSTYAKEKGLEVVIFPMDVTRSEPDFFERFLERTARNGAADGLTLVDTSGSLIPEAASYMVRRMKEVTKKRIEVHTHTDFGMGVATSLAAVAAGAEVVHGSLAGLGERTGNTPLEEVAVSLRTLFGLDLNIDFPVLARAARETARIARYDLASSKPVIGQRAFTRESGMGVNLVKEQPLALFGLHPSFVGETAAYVLGKKSGLASVEMKLADLGMEAISEEAKREVLTRIKELSVAEKRLVTDDEFRQIVRSVVA